MSLFTIFSGAPARSAASAMARSTAGSLSKMNAGTSRLKMPAFSRAISSRVFPRRFMWS